MLRRINVACIALLALPLLFTGCQPQESTPEPTPDPTPAPVTPAPTPAPVLTPFLSKLYKNGLIFRDYTYEGTRPVKVTDYTEKGAFLKEGTMSYDASGRVTRISVRSAAFPGREEDQTFVYNADGLLTKVEFTAVNNARPRQSGEANLVPGEMFAYTTFEYNANKELIKSADFVKYSTSEEWPEVANFAAPIYYMTYAYDAAGNAVKKTAHNVLMPSGEPGDPTEYVDVHTFTYDTQKNPYFYSYLLDEGTPNPRITRHNMLSRRTTSNGPMEGHYYDCTSEYNAAGFPTKRTLVEGGGYLSAQRTLVYTYEYEMR
ncbi:MAG: hypothetical protein ICV83_00585 [Cytophagales bacterium]|nr:hypothetical protein [Cytophagales bacterium]